MADVIFTFAVRDGAASPPGTRKTGLTPTWVHLKRLTDGGHITPLPTISEIGQGQYQLAYDAEAHGEAAGQIDAGAGLSNPADRYVDVFLTRERSRLVTALPVEAYGVEGGLPVLNENQQVVALVQDYGYAMAPELRLLTAPANKIATDASGRVRLDMAQAVPTVNTAQTVGDALNAARAQGFGRWVLSGTTLTLYAADGTTIVRTFTLDSATSPMQRA